MKRLNLLACFFWPVIKIQGFCYLISVSFENLFMKKIVFILLFIPFFLQAQTYKAVYKSTFEAENPMVNRAFSNLADQKVIIVNDNYSLVSSKLSTKTRAGKTKNGSFTMSTTSSSDDYSVSFLQKKQMKVYGIDTTAKGSDKIVKLQNVEPKFRVLKRKDTTVNGKPYRLLKITNASGQALITFYFDEDLPKSLMPYFIPLGAKAPKGGVYKVERIDLNNPSATTNTITLESIEKTAFDFQPFLKIIENATITADKISTLHY